MNLQNLLTFKDLIYNIFSKSYELQKSVIINSGNG